MKKNAKPTNPKARRKSADGTRADTTKTKKPKRPKVEVGLHAWKCPKCGSVCRVRWPDDEPGETLTVPPLNHHEPKKKTFCLYPGGWWRWTGSEWQEVAKLPKMEPVSDGIEFEDLSGGFLGLLPGYEKDKWMLHLIRSHDPAYPSLMQDDFAWLAGVASPDEERMRMKASYLLERYCFAVQRMERFLANLFRQTSHPQFQFPIASTLARLYDTIKLHTTGAKKPPDEAVEGGAALGRYQAFHSEEAKFVFEAEAKAKKIVATIRGKNESTKPASAECLRWAQSQMWSVWEVVNSVHHHQVRNEALRDEICALESSFPESASRYRFAITFAELWQKWLRSYLLKKWNEKRPKLKGGRTETFERAEGGILYGAALFWCHELWHFEPKSYETESKKVESLIRSAKPLRR